MFDDDPLGGPFNANHMNVDFEKFLSPQKIPQIIPHNSSSSSSSDDDWDISGGGRSKFSNLCRKVVDCNIS